MFLANGTIHLPSAQISLVIFLDIILVAHEEGVQHCTWTCAYRTCPTNNIYIPTMTNDDIHTCSSVKIYFRRTSSASPVCSFVGRSWPSAIRSRLYLRALFATALSWSSIKAETKLGPVIQVCGRAFAMFPFVL